MKLKNAEVKIIGVDLGGTKVHVAEINNAVLDGQKLTNQYKTNINAAGKKKAVLSEVMEAIDQVWSKGVQGLGLGIPSVCDIEKGIVYDVQNIPSWEKVNLKKILEKKYNVPVYLNNDANCFAIGEKYFGTGKKYKNFIGLILGTGMAGGVIINNKLYNGKNCGSGEFGMMTYKKHFFEYYCTGRYFTRNYNIRGEDMSKMAASGNKKAVKAFTKFGRHIGKAISSILYAYDTEAIVLGGSVSKSYEHFEEGLTSVLSEFVYKSTIDSFKIEISKNPDIPVLGAAALYLNNLGNRSIN